MKLVKEHINEKFAEKSDPIEDMGIGIVNWPPEEKFKYLKEEFKNCGINMTVNPSRNWGDGTWEISFEPLNVFASFNSEYDEDIDANPLDVQCFYATKEAARAEDDMEGGFELADYEGTPLMKYTYDPRLLLKTVIKRVFRSKNKVQKHIKNIQAELKILQNVENNL